MCFIATPYEKKLVEAVGEHYERLLERIYGEDEPETPVNDVANEVDDSEESKKYASHKKTKKGPTADLYELIGLGHLRWQATADEIRTAYRRTALDVHPDKMDNHDDTLFKAVNAAFDTLGDPKKRRDYDSADPFDDALPAADAVQSDDDFYRIYGAVFRLNAKWSKKTPVPDLGDANTTYAQLEVFYLFWQRFQTWREFAYLNEYEPEQAESREEKRWMERQNAKLQQDKRREDAARLMKLVDQAYSRDPRIRARRAEQEAEKARAKQEKADAKRREREDKERKQAEAEAERKRIEDEARAAGLEAKAAREKQKKAMRKKRQQLRQFGEANGVHFETIEKICELADESRLDLLIADLSNVEITKKKIDEEVDSYKSEAERRQEEEERAKVERAAEAKRAEEAKEAKWTPEELSLLTKALTKFPGGAVNRWGQIAAFLHHSKTEAEIIAKLKSVKNKDLKEKPATRETDDAFQTFLKTKKEATVVSSHSVRYDGPEMSNPAESESTTPATANASSSSAPSAASNGAASASTVPAAATAAATPAAASTVTEWTAEQQTALEAALKKYPASTEDRWGVIASAVPGRTKKECVERFKYLVSIVKGAKK